MCSAQQPFKCFLTFADSRMSAALNRIKRQAEEMNYFDDICVYNENDLDDAFIAQWKHILHYESRGYGYWCWKPHIILRALEKLPENGVLLYCDAGCHLNPKGVPRLLEYVEELMKDPIGIKAFDTYFSRGDSLEKTWTKGDLFDYFQCRNNKTITDTNQIAATQILCRKCEKAINLIQDWIQAYEKDFSLIDDSASKSPNFSGFLEHRHDQSIFSILYKLNGGIPFPSHETDSSDWSNMEAYPIWDKRDKGFKDKRFIARVKRYLKSRFFLMKVYWHKSRGSCPRYLSFLKKKD